MRGTSGCQTRAVTVGRAGRARTGDTTGFSTLNTGIVGVLFDPGLVLTPAVVVTGCDPATPLTPEA